MKQETKDLIEGLKITLKETIQDNDGLHWLNCRGNICFEEKTDWRGRILPGEYCGCVSLNKESNYNKILEMLDRLEEVEETLATGGLVKDNSGNWLKSGDDVIYRRNNDPYHKEYSGILFYDVSSLAWVLQDTDTNEILNLGKAYDEVASFTAKPDEEG